MKKLPFLNSRRKRTKAISSAEYGTRFILPDREQEILDLANREAESMYPMTNQIPEHINALERTRFKEQKENVNWAIFFKSQVMQFKP